MPRLNSLSARIRSLYAARVIVLINMAFSYAAGQSGISDTVNPLRADSNGIHLNSVSVYAGYYSSPGAYLGSPLLPGNTMQSDVGFGIGATLSWNYLRSGSGISVTYSPSYNGFTRYSNLNECNHAFSLTIHNKRDPGRKLHTNISTEANASTMTQFLFEPSALARLVDVPATYDVLTQAVVAGSFSNDQIASILTGASLPQSPAEIALLGTYYLSAGARGTVSYAPSSRLNVSISFSGIRLEALPRNDTSTPNGYLIPNSTMGTGAIQVGYSLSPRTQFQFGVDSTRASSSIQDSYNNEATVSLSRVMSRRWFLQGRAGIGNVIPLRALIPVNQSPHAIGGGGIGFKTDAHTFMLQSSVSRSDPYGIGALSTTFANAAWSWRPRISGWSALSDAEWQQMNGNTARLSSSWGGRIRLTRQLTRQTDITIAFAYLSNSGLIAQNFSNRALRSLILSFRWVPGGERRQPTENNQTNQN